MNNVSKTKIAVNIPKER